uniref:Putative DNA repair exonuclease n=1 Tax=viral metagenome TaxID=1070528 RepID=A0A6M3J6G1_9ZZZZ
MVQAQLSAKAGTRGRPLVVGSPDDLARSLSESARTSLARIWDELPPDVLRCTEGMALGEQRKYVSWQINPEQIKAKQLEVSQITDVQFGHVSCRMDRMLEYRDWILAKPNRYMLWTGDMIDAWAAWSPGRPFEQLFDPLSQVVRFAEAWAPARHRVLGFVGGNHERRAIPGFGDLGSMLAMVLKLPYSAGRQLIDLYYGDHQPFQITLWHGRGGARTKGTVAQTLDRFMQQGDSQLYLMGHLHQPLIMPAWKEVRDTRQREVRLKKCVGAVGSSFLRTWGTYGEVAGYHANDVLMPRAILEPNGKWEVTLK